MENQLITDLTSGIVIGAGGVLISNILIRTNRLYRLQKILKTELLVRKKSSIRLISDFEYLKKVLSSKEKDQFHEFEFYPELENNIRDLATLTELHLLYGSEYTGLIKIFKSIELVNQNNSHTLFKEYKIARVAKISDYDLLVTEVRIELNCDKLSQTLRACIKNIDKLLYFENTWVECLFKSLKH